MESFLSCPECGYENPQGSTACKRCLLVFEKFEKKNHKTHSIVGASTRLENIWRDLLSDYSNMDLHEKFVTQALSEKNLQFASQQYRKMKELNSADDISARMIDKIIQVATLAYASPERHTQVPKKASWATRLIVFLIFMLLSFVVAQIFTKHSMPH